MLILFFNHYYVIHMQLRCGCSYAFAALAALEGATALAHGSVDKLSEQNIVDCSRETSNNLNNNEIIPLHTQFLTATMGVSVAT